jgi:hypothetical protein
MDNTEKRALFLALSSALTGVEIDSSAIIQPGRLPSAKPGDLAPRNSPIDLASEYVRTIESEVFAESFLQTLVEFRSRGGASGDPTTVAGKLLAKNAAGELLTHDAFGPICRSIMKLWFLGSWYSPTDPKTQVRVISSNAYKEGLVWRIMRAHPMGYSNWTFGYWADEPPPLEDFVTLNKV